MFLLSTGKPGLHCMSTHEDIGALRQAQVIVREQFVATDL
jgi:hypothetical protein